MDRFALHWPGVDAQLLTDGRRCRIVWRQRGRHRGDGIGGTIDNNRQCVRRLAESLDGSPSLLGALRSRGHEQLVQQIESVVADDALPAVPPAIAWLHGLSGSDTFGVVTGRRSKTWLALGRLNGEELALRTPAPKGKPEWLIKRTWPDEPKRKAEYVAADEFKGIARWLVEAGADDRLIERLLAVESPPDNESLVSAAAVWRRVRATTAHPGRSQSGQTTP